jgi:L-ascorbate metabolism protein UlaG (beta-lactamase superfamily)
MRIKFIGHACFLVEGKEGRVITDPYNDKVPYRVPNFSADIVTVSHDHADHSAVERIKENPIVVRGKGERTVAGIHLWGIASFHDNVKGKKRGRNTIFAFEIERIWLAHLGDLGETLSEKQKEALEDVEVLFLPVGGHFTIGPEEAVSLIEELPKARIIIPMHYKTDWGKTSQSSLWTTSLPR